jgi:hypothetical protein
VGVKNGVSAELAKLIAHDPSYTCAVVFDTTWQPVTPPEGERWDYQPYGLRSVAEEAMREPLSEDFADPELWERGENGWERVGLAAGTGS